MEASSSAWCQLQETALWLNKWGKAVFFGECWGGSRPIYEGLRISTFSACGSHGLHGDWAECDFVLLSRDPDTGWASAESARASVGIGQSLYQVKAGTTWCVILNCPFGCNLFLPADKGESHRKVDESACSLTVFWENVIYNSHVLTWLFGLHALPKTSNLSRSHQAPTLHMPRRPQWSRRRRLTRKKCQIGHAQLVLRSPSKKRRWTQRLFVGGDWPAIRLIHRVQSRAENLRWTKKADFRLLPFYSASVKSGSSRVEFLDTRLEFGGFVGWATSSPQRPLAFTTYN